MKREQSLQCRVIAYNFSPKGGVEGLIVEVENRTAQVVFPPHTGPEALRSIAVGQTLALVVEPEPPGHKEQAEHPVYRFISLPSAETASNAVPLGGETISGVVVRFNYARHGAANGVVLDTGDFIRLKPEGMRQSDLKIGDRVEAVGASRPMEAGGRVVEAVAVNGRTLKRKG